MFLLNSSPLKNCSRDINDTESIGKWNTNSLKNAYGAFKDANVKGNLDLSKWNMSNVSNAGLMFNNTNIQGILNVDNWTLPNYHPSPIFSGTQAESISMNNWKLDNTTVNTPFMIGITINDMNNWTIKDTVFNPPLMSRVTINGNMNNWTIQNVNIPSFVFEYTGTTVNGTRDGWTLDGSPM